jgi:hypothetical protein
MAHVRERLLLAHCVGLNGLSIQLQSRAEPTLHGHQTLAVYLFVVKIAVEQVNLAAAT